MKKKMSALNLKLNEKDFSEIPLIICCVSLVIEKLSGLVLETGPRKLKGLGNGVSQFFWREPMLGFHESVCCNSVACCFSGRDSGAEISCLWKMFYWVPLGLTPMEGRAEGEVELQSWMALRVYLSWYKREVSFYPH